VGIHSVSSVSVRQQNGFGLRNSQIFSNITWLILIDQIKYYMADHLTITIIGQLTLSSWDGVSSEFGGDLNILLKDFQSKVGRRMERSVTDSYRPKVSITKLVSKFQLKNGPSSFLGKAQTNFAFRLYLWYQSNRAIPYR
jgi:hypothetical protein